MCSLRSHNFLGLFNSLALYMDKNEKCLVLCDLYGTFGMQFIVLLTETRGGTSTFRPHLVLKIDCHSRENVHSMCAHHVFLIAKALCMPVALA